MSETKPTRGSEGRIVVGVDGSAESRDALRWAAGEARHRHAVLEVVTAWSFERPDIAGEFHERALQLLDEATHQVKELEPDVEVSTYVEPAAAAEVLVGRSRDADLLVVGSRQRSQLTGILLGSVSQECAHRAYCPLVIVPHHDGHHHDG